MHVSVLYWDAFRADLVSTINCLPHNWKITHRWRRMRSCYCRVERHSGCPLEQIFFSVVRGRRHDGNLQKVQQRYREERCAYNITYKMAIHKSEIVGNVISKCPKMHHSVHAHQQKELLWHSCLFHTCSTKQEITLSKKILALWRNHLMSVSGGETCR